jgi:hypothetical protein
MKAAPPFSPVIVGKRHTLPSPTAEPAVARTMPKRLPKFALLSIAFLVNRLQKYNFFFFLALN